MKYICACCALFLLFSLTGCKEQTTPEERLMQDLKVILEDAYGKDYLKVNKLRVYK